MNFVQFSFVDYDGCFLLYTSSSRRKHPGSTHNYLIMAGNLHQIGYFSRKHPWVLPGCFFLWHHQLVIVYLLLSLNNSYWFKNSHLILFKDLGQDCYSTHLLRYVHKERNSVFICPLTPNKCCVRKKGFKNVLLINSWVM